VVLVPEKRRNMGTPGTRGLEKTTQKKEDETKRNEKRREDKRK
jgi:hypothetical protein